ncbi:polyphosphate kinase 1 [Sediminicola sp. 1XM1-17]|uniref:polyphosphate kinase 1 n=1 Tax=Sediminicola sp. 1XM1-17 TaxID=3127702 RepID=UPI0030787159
MEAKYQKQEFTFKDRELDWLRFNDRVLQEAGDPSNPIYERLKFLAIFSSNLDEFFKVRISKLRQLKKVDKKVRKPLGLRPNRTLKLLYREIDRQQQNFGTIYNNEILPELKKNNIHMLEISDYTEVQKSELRAYFEEHIADSLTTFHGDGISADSFEEGQLYMVGYDQKTEVLEFVKVPTDSQGRFRKLKAGDGGDYYTFLEDVLKLNVEEIFPDRHIKTLWNIKISKDAELYLDDDYQGEWVQQIYDALAKRQTGQPTRLLYERGMPTVLRKKIKVALDLGKIDLMEGGKRHNFRDFFSFPDPNKNPMMKFEPMPPLGHKAFEQCGSIFDLVKEKDQLLHFPYQDFRYLEDWITEAAKDPQLISIHISLYRIAKESRLTSALIEALDNGKEVTIFVEAKARFDEENNIIWGRKFEEKGAKVYYSFPNIKVHSKILYMERQEEDRIRAYAYIGTGNFNATTAQIYCDHALFTANPKVTKDLNQVFGILKREILLPKLKTLLISPFNLRSRFEQLILREMEHAKNDKPALIMAKMNSLEDKEMIDLLYRASNAGVKIKLLVRGFCCLVPQVKGQSENIEVISIVDRFLEHARLFLFHNHGDEELYMGSADWMTRNLDKRIEVVTPILDEDIFGELKDIIKIQFSDNTKARIIDRASSNEYVLQDRNSGKVRSQYDIYQYLGSKK